MERTDNEEIKENTIEFVYLAKENTLYHLTPFSQKRLNIPFVGLQTSDIASIDEVIEKLPSSLPLRKYLGMDDHKIYFSTVHPIEQRTKGINSEHEISLRSRNSFMNFSNITFIKYIEALKPDFVVTLSEEKYSDPRQQQLIGKKSDKRSVKKLTKFFDEVFANLDGNANLLQTRILIPLVKTEFSDVRREMIDQVTERIGKSAGIVVYGINLGKTSDKQIGETYEDIKPLLKSDIMKNKIIGCCSDGNLVDVLHKVNLGFNLFESWYPFELAKNGIAINVNPEEWIQTYEKYDGYVSDMADGHLKLDLDIFKRVIPCLTLKNPDFMRERESIFPLWESYPLKNYSKAYICHLLNNNEMTGNVILTLHNCFVYQEFFKSINSPLFKRNKFGYIHSFCKFICSKSI